MRRFLLFLVLVFLLLKAPALAFEIRNLGVGTEKGYLVCYWEVADLPYEDLEEALKHGIPLEIKFEIVLLQLRSFRRDKEILRYETSREIYFDPVKKLYFVNFIGLPRLPQQTSSLEEAFEIAGNVKALPLIPINLLQPKSTYRLKVQGILIQKVQPGLPSRLLRFIFQSGKIKSKWASIRFKLPPREKP